MFWGSKKHHGPIVIAGPHRTAKSETLDALEELQPDLFERGKKYKFRIGGPWETDGQKKDSSVLETEEAGEKLITDGKIAFDYRGPDTWHLVALGDALRTDKHMVYISDVHHDGSMRFKQFFNTRDNNEPIIFLFYTHPKLIETRLRNANIPDDQIARRIRRFKDEFAVFKDNAAEYLFLMNIEWPPLNSDIVLDEARLKKQREEIEGYANRLSQLVKAYECYYPQSRDKDYLGVHHAYINDLSQRLFDINLGDLKVRLENKEPVTINLEKELEKYTREKPLPNETRDKVRTVEVVRYQKANGRYSLWLKALIGPYDTKTFDIDPEGIVLDLLGIRLGNPTKRRRMGEQAFGKKSQYGLLHIEGGVLRDGALYSLGDSLVTDHTHPPLTIGFLNTGGAPYSMHGFTGEEINRMQQNGNGNHSQ